MTNGQLVEPQPPTPEELEEQRRLEEERKKLERWRDLGDKFSANKLLGEYRTYESFSAVEDLLLYMWKKAVAVFPPIEQGFCPEHVDFQLTEKFIAKIFRYNHRLFLKHLNRDNMSTWNLHNLELSVRSMGNNIKLVIDAKLRKWGKLVRFKGQLFAGALSAITEQAHEIRFDLEPTTADAH